MKYKTEETKTGAHLCKGREQQVYSKAEQGGKSRALGETGDFVISEITQISLKKKKLTDCFTEQLEVISTKT